jgi:outer membrane protein assembly factor BamA
MTMLHQASDIRIKAKLFPRLGILSFALLLGTSWAQAQETPTVRKMILSKIEFSGLQRHSEKEAVAASGLQIGQPVDIPTLDAAAQRLLDSGLVKQLSYRYRTTGDQAVVTFRVEEEKGTEAPVVFDNFVWFSDEELLTAVRQQVPGFNGTAPDSAVNGITKALQLLLQERKTPGRVEYMPSADLSGKAEHIFSIEGVNVPICTLNFSGANAVQESDLKKKSKALLGQDYKRSFVYSFAQSNLIPIYRERGHLRAQFRAPQAELESNSGDKCKGGVSITLPVEEGSTYSWGKTQWSGNIVLSNLELDSTLGMKSGELANGLKIDRGLKAVRETYGRKGYLAAQVGAKQEFDDASQLVTYQIDVKDGPQYRMGTLTITGISGSTISRLKSKWKLQPGEVYDASYLQEFMKKEMMLDASETGSSPKSIGTEIKPDRQRLTVDVTINLK